MPQRTFNVLFLCTGNSARSIMAEAILNRLGGGTFNGYSAGSHPSGQVNPHAFGLLARLGYATHAFRSKGWDEFANPGAPQMDLVITVCDNAANEACPIWPGHPVTAHWGIPDPAAVEGDDANITEAFREAYAILQRRIELLVDLPIEELDSASLGQRLDMIGKHA